MQHFCRQTPIYVSQCNITGENRPIHARLSTLDPTTTVISGNSELYPIHGYIKPDTKNKLFAPDPTVEHLTTFWPKMARCDAVASILVEQTQNEPWILSGKGVTIHQMHQSYAKCAKAPHVITCFIQTAFLNNQKYCRCQFLKIQSMPIKAMSTYLTDLL